MKNFRFQLLSDLHLETPHSRPSYGKLSIPVAAPYLVLLGDIGHVNDPRLFDFIEELLGRFELVLFLLGNHEAYGISLPRAKATFRSFVSGIEALRATTPGIGKLVFLDQLRFDVSESLTILGCTLFSNILPEQKDGVGLFLSDFSEICNWTIDDHNSAHASDVRWLNSQVEYISQNEPGKDIVILTHHCPTMLPAASDPQHIDDPAQVRSGFCTDLSSEPCWISPQVKLWAFGHTHFNCDYYDPVSGKRLVANQKGGKRNEALGFDVEKVLDVETPTRLAMGNGCQVSEKPAPVTGQAVEIPAKAGSVEQKARQRGQRNKRLSDRCSLQ